MKVTVEFTQSSPNLCDPMDGSLIHSVQKQHPVVDVTGDGSKVRCCKEQYCIGTWNVRSMNQETGSGQTGDGKSQRQHFRNQ